jgi:hypothetical protein
MTRGRQLVVRWGCAAAVALLTSSEYVAAAPRLEDSTPVQLRLLGLINSETSRPGQLLEFTVATDLVVDGEIVIRKGTRAGGVVVKSRRARWGPRQRRPRLTFRFTSTIASTGQVISLRASSASDGGDGVIGDRFTRHHDLLWAGGADLFKAYVDGTYELVAAGDAIPTPPPGWEGGAASRAAK